MRKIIFSLFIFISLAPLSLYGPEGEAAKPKEKAKAFAPGESLELKKEITKEHLNEYAERITATEKTIQEVENDINKYSGKEYKLPSGQITKSNFGEEFQKTGKLPDWAEKKLTELQTQRDALKENATTAEDLLKTYKTELRERLASVAEIPQPEQPKEEAVKPQEEKKKASETVKEQSEKEQKSILGNLGKIIAAIKEFIKKKFSSPQAQAKEMASDSQIQDALKKAVKLQDLRAEITDFLETQVSRMPTEKIKARIDQYQKELDTLKESMGSDDQQNTFNQLIEKQITLRGEYGKLVDENKKELQKNPKAEKIATLLHRDNGKPPRVQDMIKSCQDMLTSIEGEGSSSTVKKEEETPP